MAITHTMKGALKVVALAPIVESAAEDAVGFVRDRLHFSPDPQQASLLAGRRRRVLINCTRQWGKSTIAAARAVWQGYSAAGSLTLVVSPSGRQSAEFVRKASGFFRALGWRPRGDGDNEISLVMPNGSRIVGLPGSEATVRCFSAVSLLVIDEAARVPDELYFAVKPMLAVGDGDLWMMSTPFGKQGFFYEEWVSGDAWERWSVAATECSRISSKFLAEEKKSRTAETFGQEYMCEFTGSGGGMFDRDMVEAAFSKDVLPLDW